MIFRNLDCRCFPCFPWTTIFHKNHHFLPFTATESPIIGHGKDQLRCLTLNPRPHYSRTKPNLWTPRNTAPKSTLDKPEISSQLSS